MRFFTSLLILLSFLMIIPPLAIAVDSSDFSSSVIQYHSSRTDLQKLKDRLGPQADESVNSEYFNIRKKHFQNIAQSLSKYLTAIKNKASGMQNVDESERASLISQLDVSIQKVNTISISIDNSLNKDNLFSAARSLRSALLDSRVIARKATGQLLNSKISFMIKKMGDTGLENDKSVELLKAQNKDIARLVSLINTFKAQLAQAQSKHDAAAIKFASLNTKSDSTQAFQEGMALVKEANQLLVSANQNLTSIDTEISRFTHTLPTVTPSTNPNKK